MKWMDQAEGDLRHAESDLERSFYDWACFSSQQAAGKVVKAGFQKMGADYSNAHPPGSEEALY